MKRRLGVAVKSWSQEPDYDGGELMKENVWYIALYNGVM